VSTICAICNTPSMKFSWCDYHGIAQCTTCGAPYRLLHYDGEGDERRRVERPAELVLAEEDVPRVRRCWAETKAKLSAVHLGLSFPGGYDVAGADDIARVEAWLGANPSVSQVAR